jgi:glycosyltransferase involved in cell wall biosynthesis
MGRRILFLVPYPLGESPSQRFRFEQYFNILEQAGYSYTVQSFLSVEDWKVFFGRGRAFVKLRALAFGFGRRVIALFKSPMYDFVFIHREAAPLGPPIFEWILAKILRRRIIYDFDDAIWLTDRQNESWLLKAAKWRSKVSSICRWAYKVSCGNQYLCDYAKRFSRNVIYNPTTIDTNHLHNRRLYNPSDHTGTKIKIGWTGSHSTLKYLEDLKPVLQKVMTDYSSAEFIVIADRAPVLKGVPSFRFVPWNSETEIKDLLQLDIGIMPLPDDEWANGKCGFKALQYMALEFPALASPVGVNTKIITHGVNGFLCHSLQEWEETLKLLIEDPVLRGKIGTAGRKTIVENYSVTSNSKNFLSLFLNDAR